MSVRKSNLLYIAFDQGYVTQEEFEEGKVLCVRISGQLSGLIQYLKGSKFKGEKSKKEYKSFREERQDLLTAHKKTS